MTVVSIVRLPYVDVERFLRDRGGAGRYTARRIAEMCAVTRGTVQRWKQAGTIPEFAADRLACELGVHPATIWGDVWWSTVEPDDVLTEHELLLERERASRHRIEVGLAALRAWAEGAPWPQLRLVDGPRREAVERRAGQMDGVG